MGRNWAKILIAGLSIVGASATSQVLAQGSSTWDQIIQTKKFRMCAAPTEPWYFKDATNSAAAGAVKSGDATWRGVGPVLGKDIADAMGVQFEIVETTWANAVAALQANQCDVMFMLDPNPVRAMAIDFASPVLWYPFGLLVRDDLSVTTWAELGDPKYKLGAVTGTSTDAILTRMAPKSTIVRFQTHGEMLAAFQAGRIDGGMTTAPTADITRVNIKLGKTLIPKPLVATPAGAGIRKETDQRWKSYLQTVIDFYYNSGRTQAVYSEFLTFRGLDPATIAPIQREAF